MALLAAAPIANAATVKLQWDAPPDGATVGYLVWYGTAPGNYTDQIEVGYVTTHDVAGLLDATRYYFSVQASSANAALSPMSIEVNGTTPGASSGGETGRSGSGGTAGSGTGSESTTPTPGTLKRQWDRPADSATVDNLVW